jgi:hypothetical protein
MIGYHGDQCAAVMFDHTIISIQRRAVTRPRLCVPVKTFLTGCILLYVRMIPFSHWRTSLFNG